MKPEHVINGSIGVGGTAIAWLTAETAGIFAGVCTGLWMIMQIGLSLWDRWRSRHKRGPLDFPPKK